MLNVILKDEVPEVVKIIVTVCPTTPFVAFKVKAPDGVQVMRRVVMATLIVPVVALVAAELPALLANGNMPVTLVAKSIEPESIEFVITPLGTANVPLKAGLTVGAIPVNAATVVLTVSPAPVTVFIIC